MGQLLTKYNWHAQDFKEMIAAIKTFPVQFLFAVNTQVQKWLQSCNWAETRANLNFGDVVRSVKLKTSCTLLLAAIWDPEDTNSAMAEESATNKGKY